ncbi:unnamed protein product [Trichobilharzia regenti]|nr:unnamed protein product [Trichobilharzia regenti]
MLLFAEHANYRRSLQNCEVPNQPRPRFMEEINWDDELAQLAHRQVAACDLDSHYKEAEINKEYKSSVGKNTADNRDPYAAVREWFDEHQYYNYTRNSCSHPNGCSHYKRVS